MEQIKNFRILQGIMQLALAPIANDIFLYVQPLPIFYHHLSVSEQAYVKNICVVNSKNTFSSLYSW